MKTLLMHLGLGDAIVMAGAIVTLAEREGGLRVPAWPHNKGSLRSFFAHHPEVVVCPVKNERELLELKDGDHWYSTGVYLTGHSSYYREGFDRWFYRQLDLPLDLRWDACPIRNAAMALHYPIEIPKYPYAFVHDDPVRGFTIPHDSIKMPSLRPWHYPSILAWREAIEWADEVHCINSSFLHLAESLRPRGKLFYHRYARKEHDAINEVSKRHDWTVLEEPL